MILTNPVLIAIVMLLVLCFLRVNVLLALFASVVTAGLIAGMDVSTTVTTFITGIGEDPRTALSYVMLGGLVATISYTGVSDILVIKIAKLVNGKSLAFAFFLGSIFCFPQNLTPVHIAFILILIPPLLIVMNRMKIDGRVVACTLAFGLYVPYVVIPVGSGPIYHGIISNNMTKNGMEIDKIDVQCYIWPPGVVMLIGFAPVVLFLYRRPKEYENVGGFAVDLDTADITMAFKRWSAVIVAVVTLVTQLAWGSLSLGALIGLVIMLITKAVKWSDMDKIIDESVQLVGFIASVMLASNGSSAVLRDSGGVDQLIQSSLGSIGGSKLLGASTTMPVGLFIVMDTGTPFGTVPALAVLYVPLCARLDFSVDAVTLLTAAAATIGDIGSPVSDITLGPAAGPNADGRHDHIQDTCVPTFTTPDIPISILAIVTPLLM